MPAIVEKTAEDTRQSDAGLPNDWNNDRRVAVVHREPEVKPTSGKTAFSAPTLQKSLIVLFVVPVVSVLVGVVPFLQPTARVVFLHSTASIAMPASQSHTEATALFDTQLLTKSEYPQTPTNQVVSNQAAATNSLVNDDERTEPEIGLAVVEKPSIEDEAHTETESVQLAEDVKSPATKVEDREPRHFLRNAFEGGIGSESSSRRVDVQRNGID